nr:integrator complex subunit 9 isoform X2 [Malus domestica]
MQKFSLPLHYSVFTVHSSIFKSFLFSLPSSISKSFLKGTCSVSTSSLSTACLVPMKLTCLSKEASHLDKESPNSLNYSDLLDLEEPLFRKRQKVEKSLDADDLICAVPWYKTVKNLHLWNASFIDAVLISSPMGMLGLPFITRMKGFSAKIYVTEATARLGQLMMEDLVSMHMEIRQLFGPEESSFPRWMKWEVLKLLPSSLRRLVLGKDGGELGGWMPLYRYLILYPNS